MYVRTRISTNSSVCARPSVLVLTTSDVAEPTETISEIVFRVIRCGLRVYVVGPESSVVIMPAR